MIGGNAFARFLKETEMTNCKITLEPKKHKVLTSVEWTSVVLDTLLDGAQIFHINLSRLHNFCVVPETESEDAHRPHWHASWVDARGQSGAKIPRSILDALRRNRCRACAIKGSEAAWRFVFRLILMYFGSPRKWRLRLASDFRRVQKPTRSVSCKLLFLVVPLNKSEVPHK